jgi:S1-C subfamily serine protease
MNAVLLLLVLANPQTESTLERIEREITAIVEKARPSVVQIVAKRNDEDFQSTIATPGSIQASGFIVSSDGFILTDLGPVEAARDIFVTLHDGRRLKASLRAADRASAVALLRVAADKLQAVEFADADAVRQGSMAVLVSNPVGLNQSFSVGFVSGIDRSIVVGGARYDDMIQTSASVQSGDCGGLLANSRGLVLGMIHSRYVPDGIEPDPAGFLRPVPRGGMDFLPAGGPAVGFATPSATLRFVADRLMKHGRVVRGWAGIALKGAAPATVVAEVVRGGPAWRAGIRRGDKVIEFDGQAPVNLPAIRRKVVETSETKTVRVRIVRAGATMDLDLTIEPEPVQ